MLGLKKPPRTKPYGQQRYLIKRMKRKETYTVEEVLSKIDPEIPISRSYYGSFGDDEIKLNSWRYLLFLEKGTDCVKCGLKGLYFAKERHFTAPSGSRYHLSLYGKLECGQEVLMTVDHIIPKVRGGQDTMDNFQPMCLCCNMDKSANIEDSEKYLQKPLDTDGQV